MSNGYKKGQQDPQHVDFDFVKIPLEVLHSFMKLGLDYFDGFYIIIVKLSKCAFVL